MKPVTKQEMKTWAVYFGVIMLAIFVHELGHSITAWIFGYQSFPTFAKAYPLEEIPASAYNAISLGGILASAIFTLVVLFLYSKKTFRFNNAVLAAAIANPGLYAVLFLFKGRGHGDAEFQQAQAAAGFSYAGHVVDWLFVTLFISGIITWYIRSKPGYKIYRRFLVGFVLTFIFIVALQVINNAIFDPVFLSE